MPCFQETHHPTRVTKKPVAKKSEEASEQDKAIAVSLFHFMQQLTPTTATDSAETAAAPKRRKVQPAKTQQTATAQRAAHRMLEDASGITYNLAPANSLAGAVLVHTIRVVENLFDRYQPLVFKIGFTHCPFFRMTNSLYGYSNGSEFRDMVVLHQDKDPGGPAMLEAALINKYQSSLLA